MSLSQDLTPIRELFPITKEFVYFNHAGTGPLSTPAREVMEECMAIFTAHAELPVDEYFAKVKEWRMTVANLMNVKPQEITFVHNTSEALYIALMNVPLERGDKVLVMEEAFPAIRYIVKNNLPGIEKIFVPFLNNDPVEVVRDNLDDKLKVVVLELAHYLTGEMFNIEPLAKFLRERNIFLIVDGIQVVGALNLDISTMGVDFLACGAGKWLFGPTGAGFLYVNRKHISKLKGTHVGWLGAQWRGFEDCQISPPLYPDARMFELGSRNIIGLSALAENINILLKYGMANVQKSIMSLKDDMRQKFGGLGYEILTPIRPPQSGILTVRPPGNAQEIFRRLKNENIIVSLRSGALRFSPHFYNTKNEIERIFRILRQ
ncbi:MAG: aminotransferase class V-fold PLP-dependent enzyme [bacterium]